jgi:hypothetical protein
MDDTVECTMPVSDNRRCKASRALTPDGSCPVHSQVGGIRTQISSTVFVAVVAYGVWSNYQACSINSCCCVLHCIVDEYMHCVDIFICSTVTKSM